MYAFIRRLADKGMAAEYIRMDNSGENKKLMERATGADWKLNPKWEFTARSTPQQNGLVEVEFATIAGRGRAMCNTANMSAKVRILVANEALSYSTALGNLVVDKDCRQTRYERMGLKNPKWAQPGIMRTFGEAGVVKRGKNGKLGDRGIPMVFVGYAENHSHDCYRMWYPTTRKVTESRDVIWLHRMYYQDDVIGDMAMLPEVRMAVHEISNDSIAALKLDGLGKWEPGGTDPVHDDTEIESVSSDNQPDIKVESEAREGEDDAVTEASDSDTEPERKTRSGRVVRVPQKYDGFEMTAAEIRLMQCDDAGKVKDYIGCKLDISSDGTSLKMTQPALVQSLSDEFEDIPQGKAILVPAKPGNILTKCENSPKLSPEKHSRYRTGVGKLLYLTKHSRPDIANAVRELSRHCHDPTEAHWEAMCDCIRYVRGTPTRGLLLKPSGSWDGKDQNFQFEIRGRSDSNYATDPESRRSITGTVVYLNDAPIAFSSVTQKHVTLSVTEAELAAVVTMVQDMMYIYRVINSMGLKVKLPMIAEMDNSGARDLANSWSVGGRTRHVDVWMFFLCELKEDGMVAFKHIPGPDNG
eukprot:CCRYP_013697-RA/>CCRYP_013697-RA protein AED:0.44 eAED:-0.15 QI:0/0/0/0.5/1/1/2/0/583